MFVSLYDVPWGRLSAVECERLRSAWRINITLIICGGPEQTEAVIERTAQRGIVLSQLQIGPGLGPRCGCECLHSPACRGRGKNPAPANQRLTEGHWQGKRSRCHSYLEELRWRLGVFIQVCVCVCVKGLEGFTRLNFGNKEAQSDKRIIWGVLTVLKAFHLNDRRYS